MSNTGVNIVSYRPEYAVHFERLNKAWIEKDYVLEPPDKYVLENPEEAVLKEGGKILFAEREGKIIGTVALKYVAPGVFELAKMAVDEGARGTGAGKLLCYAAIEEAKKMNAEKIILYSNTRQSAAISLYRQAGFTELPVEPGVYERANIKMELPLKDGFSQEEISALVESYGKAHGKITDCLKSIPKEMWGWQPPYGKWTIRQNLIHLADTEANAYVRCRRFIAEPGSGVLGYDQNIWASRLYYDRQNAEDALELYRLLRKMSYDLVRQIPFDMWENTIEHVEYGTMKMWQWLRVYENHTHVFQMQRVYQEWKKMQHPA
jgi:N-acetylglutamate synthase-like GNAT family acetyltransferase